MASRFLQVLSPFVQSLRTKRFGRPYPPLGKRRPYKHRLAETPKIVVSSLDKCDDHNPLQDVVNPYAKERKQCILCQYDVKLDYKNSRLLSQFISSFSGRVYEKNITGICQFQQQKLIEEIKKSRSAGYMPLFCKDPKFLKDPRWFDPMRPQRPNRF